jgi:hypothetical protein
MVKECVNCGNPTDEGAYCEGCREEGLVAGGLGEEEFQEVLRLLIQLAAEDCAGEVGDVEIEDVATFRDAGLLSGNKGLVVTLRNGQEFQLTIVKSREAR